MISHKTDSGVEVLKKKLIFFSVSELSEWSWLLNLIFQPFWDQIVLFDMGIKWGAFYSWKYYGSLKDGNTVSIDCDIRKTF